MSRLRNLNAYDRHKLIVNEYILKQPGSTAFLKRDILTGKRDFDVVRENHKFLWDDEEADSWEKRLAKKYYDKLFKEYCICDLSRYKENQIALRWRIEKEVISGKGQFVCGNKICPSELDLCSWEVNFGYLEHGEKKNALVKLRLCPECSLKLNYHTKKREVKRMKKTGKRKNKKHKNKKEAVPGAAGPSSENPCIGDNEKLDGGSSSGEDSQDNTKEDEMNDEGIWSRPIETEEMSREEEFEKYLEDLLL